MVFSSPWRPAELHARALVTSGGARDTRAVRSPRATLKVCFAHLVSGLPIAHGAQELRLALGDPVLAGAHSLLGEYGARRVVPPAPTTSASAVGPEGMTAGCPWNAKAGNLASRLKFLATAVHRRAPTKMEQERTMDTPRVFVFLSSDSFVPNTQTGQPFPNPKAVQNYNYDVIFTRTDKTPPLTPTAVCPRSPASVVPPSPPSLPPPPSPVPAPARTAAPAVVLVALLDLVSALAA